MDKLLIALTGAVPVVNAGMAVIQLVSGFLQQMKDQNLEQPTEEMEAQLEQALKRRAEAEQEFKDLMEQ